MNVSLWFGLSWAKSCKQTCCRGGIGWRRWDWLLCRTGAAAEGGVDCMSQPGPRFSHHSQLQAPNHYLMMSLKDLRKSISHQALVLCSVILQVQVNQHLMMMGSFQGLQPEKQCMARRESIIASSLFASSTRTCQSMYFTTIISYSPLLF